MQYLIGIVPPVELTDNIIHFRNHWCYEATEPHITIKAPGGLSENCTWLDDVRGVIGNYYAFDIKIGEVGKFGESVVYFKVISDTIDELHRNLVSVISPSTEDIKRDFELNNFIPHLTIMNIKSIIWKFL